MLCRCGPRPTHPPYRHGAKQIHCLGNKGGYLELQSVDTTSAAHALPVQTDVVRILDGSGFRFLLRPRPQKRGDYISQKAVRGGGDGRDAMADSLSVEVRGSGPQAWVGDRPRLRGPELWGRAV